jgi:hypothetical protein
MLDMVKNMKVKLQICVVLLGTLALTMCDGEYVPPDDGSNPFGVYEVVDPASPDLMVKFGIKDAGYEFNSQTANDVSDTFKALHAYINDRTKFTAATDKTTSVNIVRLGDYIDLPHLEVQASDLVPGDDEKTGRYVVDTPDKRGAISVNNLIIPPYTEEEMWDAWWARGANYERKLLRLIVAGINSFNRRSANPDTRKPHVVFQFHNLPGEHRMHPNDVNDMGYAGCEMRGYLKNNFLPGLLSAGVPEAVIWAPKRLIWKGSAYVWPFATGTDEIIDKLWLPTEWEITGGRLEPQSQQDEETGANQAFLEYYDVGTNKLKFNALAKNGGYFLASPSRNPIGFSFVGQYGDAGYTGYAASPAFIAPAFCVW